MKGKISNVRNVTHLLLTISKNLESHNLRVHLKIRPYEYNSCDKAFERKRDLNKHVKNNYK